MRKVRIVRVNNDDKNVLLAGDLNFKETSEILDILKNVNGLTFDFHRELRLNDLEMTNIYSQVQDLCKKYFAEKTQILQEQMQDIDLSGFLQHKGIDIAYNFGNMSGEDIVKSRFRSGYVRVENSRNRMPIVSFDSGSRFQPVKRYECRLHNFFPNDAKNLYNVLEGKLVKPEFMEDLSLDI